MSGVGKITTPGSSFFSGKNGKGTFSWASGFANRMNANFRKKQAFVDSEVLRRCDLRVPLKTGFLKTSGKLGTSIGSGEVKYTAPYAAYQYYDTAETRSYDANRGAKWFERMKTSEKDDILRGMKQI